MGYWLLGLISAGINFYWARSHRANKFGWAVFGFFLPLTANAVMWFVVVRKSRKKSDPVITVSQSNDGSIPPPPPPAVRRERTAKASVNSLLMVEARGWFNADVVGESNYFNNIKKIVGGRDGEHTKIATLIREPNNKFDKNAVRIDIDGLTVGYIPRDEAVGYHRLLEFAAGKGRSLGANARLWWNEDYGSVSLDLTEPDFAVFVNADSLPSEAVIWPSGNKYQVTKETDYLPSIQKINELCYGTSGCAIYLEAQCEMTEKNKQVISLSYLGEKVGELSAQMSKKFWPGFSVVSQSQKALYVRANVVQSALSAEIVIFAKSPEEITPAELKYLNSSN